MSTTPQENIYFTKIVNQIANMPDRFQFRHPNEAGGIWPKSDGILYTKEKTERYKNFLIEIAGKLDAKGAVLIEEEELITITGE